MTPKKLISDLGEKEVIRSIIKPLLNPRGEPDLVGDDCAVFKLSDGQALCISTDRVPADLISFKLGLIDYHQLGNYLAVLNLSDIAAMGARPLGLLLNLGLPPTLPVSDFEQLLDGAAKACERVKCQIVGGDLSNSLEMSISATSVGIAQYHELLRRSGSEVGDHIYCTDVLGLTSTAFHYFLVARNHGMRLSSSDEDHLAAQFRDPQARFASAGVLSQLGAKVTCMDNTDGVGQTLSEMAEINGVAFELELESLPVHDLSRKVAAHLGMDLLDVVLGPGADFQLLGTLPKTIEWGGGQDGSRIEVIGRVVEGAGLFVNDKGVRRPLSIQGWNYFSPMGQSPHAGGTTSISSEPNAGPQ